MKLLRWIILNTVFLYFTILGTFYHNIGCLNIVKTIICLLIFSTIVILCDVDKVVKNFKPSVPSYVELLYDIIIFLILAYNGHNGYAFFYIIHSCIVQALYDKKRLRGVE